MSLRDLRLGVIGVGARSRLVRHALDLGAQLVAAADPSPHGRARARALFGETIEVVSDPRTLIERDLDAVFVTSPDDTHADIACAALEAGAAVYLEKPIAITTADADRVLETARASGTKLYVGHNMRHMSVVTLMRDIIQRGEIGEVKTIWCRHFVGHGGDFYFKDWHAERRRTTGLLLQKGAHDLDVMHWLAGSRTREVVAMGDLMVYGEVSDRAEHPGETMQDWFSLDNWPPRRQTGLNRVIDVEDVSALVLRMESGVIATYQQSHFTPDYWRNYTVIGTEGRLENFGDGAGGAVKVWNRRSGFSPEADRSYPIAGDEEGHDDADELTVEEFLRFVAEDRPTRGNPVSARDAVAAGAAATLSLRSGSSPQQVAPAPRVVRDHFSQFTETEATRS